MKETRNCLGFYISVDAALMILIWFINVHTKTLFNKIWISFRSCLKRKKKCWRIRLEAVLLYPFHRYIFAACSMKIYIFLECSRLANIGHTVQGAVCLIIDFHSMLFLFLVSFFWGFWPSPPLLYTFISLFLIICWVWRHRMEVFRDANLVGCRCFLLMFVLAPLIKKQRKC